MQLKNIKKSKIKFLIASLLISGINSAYASCSASSSLSFGAYNPSNSAHQTSSSHIQVSCSTDTSLSIKINTGNSGSYSNRFMSNTKHNLYYNLYSDVNMTTVFGDGTNGTYQYSGTVGSSTVSVPVFGKIPSNQNVSSGIYQDNLTITLVF